MAAPVFHPMTRRRFKSRTRDRFGSGQYGASRAGGARRHHGIDVVTRPGEMILSPIDGEVVREAIPYRNDHRYRGILIRGSGTYAGYQVKVFYANGLLCGRVRAGHPVAVAQDLTQKYPGITNHVHVEVRKNGKLLNPEEAYMMCF